jgi:decaprenyl-phosphate phosphoribosyltransferase
MTDETTATPVRPRFPLLAACRPRQWIENVLVLAAPLAAGLLLDPDVLLHTIAAFLAFTATASGVYLINDAADVERDRAHPVKRFRPVAAGWISVGLSVGVGAALIAAAIVASAWGVSVQLAITLATYAVLQAAYSRWLKHIAVVDLAVVSSGFLLRAVAGGAATGIELSPYFLLVAAFGSLFMVAGKRYSEIHLMGTEGTSTRPSLSDYSASYLRFVWGMAGAVTLTFYSQWAFAAQRDVIWPAQLSIAFFTLGMMRYAVDIDRGAAGEPEAIVLGDRVLQVIGLLWLASFVLGTVL